MPLLFQIGFKFTPQRSGLLLAPISLGVLLIKPLSMSILRYLGYKRLLVINTFLVSLILAAFTLINPLSNVLTISLFTFLYGFFIALQYTGMNSLAYATIQEEELSSATSIMSTIQQLAQSFGVAFAALLINLFSPQFSIQSEFIIKAIHRSLFAMSAVTLCSIIIFWKLKNSDGQELIHKH